VDAVWVKRVFNGLEGIPAVTAILGIASTTAKKAVVVFKGAGCDHAGTSRVADGATV
jgi:hypothetical protein